MKNEVMEKKNEIQARIMTIRGVQVMQDRDLAALYGVETKALNQAVKRNAERFPEGFMFQLTDAEWLALRSQVVTSNTPSTNVLASLRSQCVTSKRGGQRYRPYVFTEHGVVMLASVLKSEAAVQASLRIVSVFVAMRRALSSMAPLLTRIEATERRQIVDQSKNEERFKVIFDAMNAEKILASDSKLLLREPRRIRRIPSLGLRNPRLDTRVWAEALRIFLEATCWKASRATRGHPEGTSDYRRKATCRVASKKTPRRAAAQPESNSMGNIRRSPCARAASFTTDS